jgi:SAM-dependent methyltransferase
VNVQEGVIRAIYSQVIDEYHGTPLAKLGYVFKPTQAKFREVEALARYLPEGGTLLDIGTGMAIVPRTMKRLGARVISVDPPFSSSVARENANLAGIETLVCDVTREAIPLEDGTVDCILFADVIEHLVHSPRPAVVEFARVLRPGGVVVATTPNAVRLPVRLKVVLGHSNWQALDDFYDQEVHGGHHHEYTPEEFRASFERAGFEIAEFLLHGSTMDVRVDSFAALDSRVRHGTKRSHPAIALAKLPIAALEAIFPRMRRDMLLVARKVT